MKLRRKRPHLKCVFVPQQTAMVLKNWKWTRKQRLAICKELVALADKHNGYPITYLVYFAVGKNAHRNNVFDKGYKKIDLQKANRIFMWLNQYAKHEGDPSVARDANVAHALTAYYERKTKNPVTIVSVNP